MGIVYINTPVGTGPDATFVVFIKTTDEITSNADGIFGIMTEYFEAVSVEAVQAVDCSKPEKPVFILETASDTVVGQSAFHTVMFEIILLGMKSRKKAR